MKSELFKILSRNICHLHSIILLIWLLNNYLMKIIEKKSFHRGAWISRTIKNLKKSPKYNYIFIDSKILKNTLLKKDVQIKSTNDQRGIITQVNVKYLR